MNNNSFDNDNNSNNNDNQFVISQELLELFRWLFEEEQETLKKLIERSLNRGLNDKLMQKRAPLESNEELQESIVSFFILLETLLEELLNEDEVKKIVERNLIPAINHIDINECDNNTLELSVAKATDAYQNNSNSDPKVVLCKELLRRWKTSKKTVH